MCSFIDALTGQNIWTKNYDRKISDIFALQDDIAWNLTTELQVHLTEGEQARVLKRETDNPEAYFAYMKGLESLRASQGDARKVHAQQLLKKALALDPDFASAWAILGHIYRRTATYAENPKGICNKHWKLHKKHYHLMSIMLQPMVS